MKNRMMALIKEVDGETKLFPGQLPNIGVFLNDVLLMKFFPRDVDQAQRLMKKINKALGVAGAK